MSVGDDLGVDAAASVSDFSGIVGVDLTPTTDAAAVPISVPTNTWTWVPVEGAYCEDGTQTGIGVNPGSTPDKLVLYFEGGGACGDDQSCNQLHTATGGPFGETEFTQASSGFGTLLTRNAVGNPFATWTMIYIPYCTGDLHGGITTSSFGDVDAGTAWQFVGHINALRDLDRVNVTWPTLSTLVVSGSSAGGYGALINYPDARSRWSSAKSYLIDDSGPPLEKAYTSPLLTEWYTAWHLIDWAQGGCPECIGDVSQLLPNVAGRFPNDRMSLLESEEDEVISGFYLLDGPTFSMALTQLATDRIVPLPKFKYFFISGKSHTMLGSPAAFTSGTTSLTTFLDLQLTDDPSWASTAPSP